MSKYVWEKEMGGIKASNTIRRDPEGRYHKLHRLYALEEMRKEQGDREHDAVLWRDPDTKEWVYRLVSVGGKLPPIHRAPTKKEAMHRAEILLFIAKE